jgi:hypothetical protein
VNTTDLEATLRARLRSTIDPHVPGVAAEHRALASLVDQPRRHIGHTFGRGFTAVLAAAVVIVVVGGALTIGLALRNHASTRAGQAPAGNVPPHPVITAPPAAQACTGDQLTAWVFDTATAHGASGGDIALHNNGSRPCTMRGYVTMQAIVGAVTVQPSVAHSVSATLLNNAVRSLPDVSIVTVEPGQDAYVAYETSNIPLGATACARTDTLLITPPQGTRYTALTGTSINLCGADGAATWIDEGPVSAAPYFPQNTP